MAELQLEWQEGALLSGAWRMARAYVGSAHQMFELQASGPGADGLFRWNAYWGPEGTAPTLVDAQLAAEASAFAWLLECVAGFGASLLTWESVPRATVHFWADSRTACGAAPSNAAPASPVSALVTCTACHKARRMRVGLLEQLAERVVTVANEATGPLPVMPAEEALTLIERKLFADRRLITELEATRDRVSGTITGARVLSGDTIRIDFAAQRVEVTPERLAKVEAESAEKQLALRALLGDLVAGIEWWAAQEDGVPDHVFGAYSRARIELCWADDGSVMARAAAVEKKERDQTAQIRRLTGELAAARAKCALHEGREALALQVLRGERDVDSTITARTNGRPPVLVHVLIAGHAACGAGAPATWREDAPGAVWVRESEADDATCEPCRAAVERLRVERTCSGRGGR